MEIDFKFSPSKEDVSTIYDGLLEFNKPHFPDLEENSFGLFVRDQKTNILGGLTGKFLFTTCHITYLWLSESIRGKGMGTKLIKQIESEAKILGIENIFLDTYTFQAPGFYEKIGFNDTGRYKDYPLPGVDKVFYQKRII